MNARVYRAGSKKTDRFRESVIRDMSRLAALHKAVNLGQGVPDFPCPPELKDSVTQAVLADINQYSNTWGDVQLREAVAQKSLSNLGSKVEPETQVTITCGATEAMVAALIALIDAEEELIVFEPFYENYGPEAIFAGATTRHVPLKQPDWTFDEKELAQAFNDKTRAIIVNTPHNPTGKVFSKEELSAIAKLCQKWGVIAITDEIYEHILYDGHEHFSIASLPGMEELTVTISSLSKTYSVTGWRVGWAIASVPLTASIRKVHDFLSVCAPAPLQRGGVKAIKMPQKFYDELANEYEERRKHLLDTLDMVGIPYFKPQGAYYVFCDVSRFGFKDDVAFAKHLVEEVGVAVVPGTSFLAPTPPGRQFVRFCFSRKLETLKQARERLVKSPLLKPKN